MTNRYVSSYENAERVQTLSTFAALWEAAATVSSLDPAPAKIARDAVARYEKLQAEADRTAAFAGDLVEALAAGDISLADAASQTLDGPKNAAAQELFERASLKILGDAGISLRVEYGDRLITEHLRPAYAALVAETWDLKDAVAGVQDDRGAAKMGAAGVKAWARLSEISEALAMLRACVSHEYVPRLNDPQSYAAFRFADAPLNTTPEDTPSHPARALIESLATNPTLHTASEVAELSRALDAQERASNALGRSMFIS